MHHQVLYALKDFLIKQLNTQPKTEERSADSMNIIYRQNAGYLIPNSIIRKVKKDWF